LNQFLKMLNTVVVYLLNQQSGTMHIQVQCFLYICTGWISISQIILHTELVTVTFPESELVTVAFFNSELELQF